jgi:hypothetical protein
MYAVDRQQTLEVLNDVEPREAPQHCQSVVHDETVQDKRHRNPTIVASTSITTEPPSVRRRGLQRNALGLGLRIARLAGSRVISCTPEHALRAVRQSLELVRDTFVEVSRPASSRQHGLPVASSPELEELVASVEKPAPCTWPTLSTVVHLSRNDIVWTCGQPV